MQNDELIIHNQVRKKILRKTSSRIGLHNLGERYKLTTSKEISVHGICKRFHGLLTHSKNCLK